MKKFLIVFLLALSVVLFSGCTGEEENTSENNTTVDIVSESNNTQYEGIHISDDKNITANPVEENESISKTPLIEVPLAKGFSRYTDDIFGFSVDYPETWEQAGVGGLGGMAFNPSGEDSYSAAILVTVFSNESEAKWWIADKEMFEAAEQSGGVMKFETVTINGREGTELISNPVFLSNSDSTVVACVAVFDVEDYYYTFYAFCSDNYKSNYEKVFETSLNSFVIDENLKAE